MKAEILEIGTFDKEGNPVDWLFDCKGTVPGFDINTEGEKMTIKIGGYTLEELHEIYETHKNLNP